MALKLKCIAPINHIVYRVPASEGVLASGPRKVQVGDTFKVAKNTYPAAWRGKVVVVDGVSECSWDKSGDGEKVAVTNPAQSEELEAAKAAYKQATGNPAHHTWDADAIYAKLAEIEG